MINHRRHKRVPIMGTVTLKYKDKGDFRSMLALPGSISLKGLGLYVDDLIEDDTNVSTTINFMSFEGIKPVSIEASVVYSKNIGSLYFMGIQFKEEINSEKHYLLHEHMQKILALNK
jgi:hypothetical protein